MSFLAVHPVVPVSDCKAALRYYRDKLGFVVSFSDNENDPRYIGVQRDRVEIHLQWHDPASFVDRTVDRGAFRFLVDDPDQLFAEFVKSSAVPEHKMSRGVHDTPWGTREFEFYDPDGNALFFYRDL